MFERKAHAGQTLPRVRIDPPATWACVGGVLIDPDEWDALALIARTSGAKAAATPANPIQFLQGCPTWLWIVLRRLQARGLIVGARRRGWQLTARGQDMLAGCRREVRP